MGTVRKCSRRGPNKVPRPSHKMNAVNKTGHKIENSCSLQSYTMLLHKGRYVHLGGPNPLLLKWIQSALSVSLMKFNRGEAMRGANDVAKRLIAASGTGPATFRYNTSCTCELCCSVSELSTFDWYCSGGMRGI